MALAPQEVFEMGVHIDHLMRTRGLSNLHKLIKLYNILNVLLLVSIHRPTKSLKTVAKFFHFPLIKLYQHLQASWFTQNLIRSSPLLRGCGLLEVGSDYSGVAINLGIVPSETTIHVTIMSA